MQHRYTPEPKLQGYPEAVRQQAMQFAVDGLNYRRIAHLLGVDHKSVKLGAGLTRINCWSVRRCQTQ